MLKAFIFVVIVTCTLITTLSSLTPQTFETNIKTQAQFYKIKVFRQNLGTTVEGNQIIVYGFTTIKNATKIQDLLNVPSTLLTCMMHPRELNSIKFLQELLINLFNKTTYDGYIEFMMQRSIVWVIPFVNIDGFKLLLDAQKGIKNVQTHSIRKNRNKGNSTCRSTVQEGVDINRNFNSSWGTVRASSDQCGQQYRGIYPFSQKQTEAIRLMYRKYNIKIAVDIHSYGNNWIYPYASDNSQNRIKKNQLYPVYQRVNKQFTQNTKIHVSSCFEALKYLADGVYIDWALDRKALSYAFQFGKSFDDPNINDDIQQALKSFWILFRQISHQFKLYRHPLLKDMLIVQSLSFLGLKIKLINAKYELGPKQLKPQQKLVIQLKQQQQGFKIIIENTSLSQVYLLSDLQVDPTGGMNELEKYPYLKFYILGGVIFVILLQLLRRKIARDQSIILEDQQQYAKINQIPNVQIPKNFDLLQIQPINK